MMWERFENPPLCAEVQLKVTGLIEAQSAPVLKHQALQWIFQRYKHWLKADGKTLILLNHN